MVWLQMADCRLSPDRLSFDRHRPISYSRKKTTKKKLKNGIHWECSQRRAYSCKALVTSDLTLCSILFVLYTTCVSRGATREFTAAFTISAVRVA